MKLELPTVTLITVHGQEAEVSAKVLRFCMQFADFGAVKLLSSKRPKCQSRAIDHYTIDDIDYSQYSQFVMNRLTEYVETPHCLVVQADGFITNPSAWNEAFLGFDYIGAPWPAGAFWCPNCRVGNGGFSLRSKKLLDLTATFEFNGGNEDYVITNHYYEQLMRHGIRVAPVDVAVRFSCELPCDDVEFNPAGSFGFHGRHFTSHLQRLETFEEQMQS